MIVFLKSDDIPIEKEVSPYICMTIPSLTLGFENILNCLNLFIYEESLCDFSKYVYGF